MADGSKEFMTNLEVEERCIQWIKSQSGLASSPAHSGSRHETDCDLEERVDTDSEFDSVSECGGRKRRHVIKTKDDDFNYICEWKDCVFTSHSLDNFVTHVSSHVPQLDVQKTEAGKEFYVCLWKDCDCQNDNADEITKHVNYHSYHTKLKCIGASLRKKIKLPVSYHNIYLKLLFYY